MISMTIFRFNIFGRSDNLIEAETWAIDKEKALDKIKNYQFTEIRRKDLKTVYEFDSIEFLEEPEKKNHLSRCEYIIEQRKEYARLLSGELKEYDSEKSLKVKEVLEKTIDGINIAFDVLEIRTLEECQWFAVRLNQHFSGDKKLTYDEIVKYMRLEGV